MLKALKVNHVPREFSRPWVNLVLNQATIPAGRCRRSCLGNDLGWGWYCRGAAIQMENMLVNKTPGETGVEDITIVQTRRRYIMLIWSRG